MRTTTTVKSDLTGYLAYKQSYLRESSYKVYRNFGTKFTAFLTENSLSELPTRKVSPALCEQYKRHILRLYKDATTRNKEIGQMKCFFYQFTKPGWERYKVSPAANVELLPKQDSDLHEPYSEQQVAWRFRCHRPPDFVAS